VIVGAASTGWGCLCRNVGHVNRGVKLRPYFAGCGIFLLAIVGLLTFDTLWKGLLPPAWYLLFHLLEANFITPVLLDALQPEPGRHFRLANLLDVALGSAWRFVVGAILVSIKVICERVRQCPRQRAAHSESNNIFENLKLLRLRRTAAMTVRLNDR